MERCRGMVPEMHDEPVCLRGIVVAMVGRSGTCRFVASDLGWSLVDGGKWKRGWVPTYDTCTLVSITVPII